MKHMDPWKHLIGSDPWLIEGQWRNNRDEYLPHMTRDVNAPTFLALNRLISVPNQHFSVTLQTEIETFIEFEFSTPMMFPFNKEVFGSNSTAWSGDNRAFGIPNNISSITARTEAEGVK